MRVLTAILTFLIFTTTTVLAQRSESNYQTVKLKVELHCEGCAGTIEDKLPDTKGVKSANVNYAKKEAYVKYDATKTSPDKIIKSLKKMKIKAKVAKR